jgi:hypothetical protein
MVACGMPGSSKNQESRCGVWEVRIVHSVARGYVRRLPENVSYAMVWRPKFIVCGQIVGDVLEVEIGEAVGSQNMS